MLRKKVVLKDGNKQPGYKESKEEIDDIVQEEIDNDIVPLKTKKQKQDDHRDRSVKKQKLPNPANYSYYQFITAIHQFITKNEIGNIENAVKFLIDYSPNTLVWPKNNLPLTIKVEKDQKGDSYRILISEENNKELNDTFCIVMEVSSDNLLIDNIRTNDQWAKNDIHDLIHHFSFLFRLNIEYSNQLKNQYDEKLDIEQPLDWYDVPEEFNSLCAGLQNRFSLPYFLNYHTKYENNEYVFWLAWKPEAYDQLSLKITLSPFSFNNTDYFPWTFAEDEFAKLYNYRHNQYFRINVYEHYEIDSTTKLMKILDSFFSLDLSFGELRDFNKGNQLSGTEILTVFEEVMRLLIQIIRPKNVKATDVYLCDSSRSSSSYDRMPGQNVFRISHSLAKGKTLYEGLGFKAVTATGVKSGCPDINYRINQNSDIYDADRKALRQLAVNDLYVYFKQDLCKNKGVNLDADEAWHYENDRKRAENLNALCKRTFNIDLDNRDNESYPTVGELGSKLYGLFKEGKSKTAASDFQLLHDIFILPDRHNSPLTQNNLFQAKKQVHDLQRTLAYTQIFKKSY